MALRRATLADHAAVLPLYRALAGDIAVAPDAEAWAALLAHPGTDVHLSVTEAGPVAMSTVHVLPNLTYGGRPYALIENVASAPAVRGHGHGRAVMQAAIGAAWGAGSYKVMLLTGRHREAEGFYRALGFDESEKAGMILRAPGPEGKGALRP